MDYTDDLLDIKNYLSSIETESYQSRLLLDNIETQIINIESGERLTQEMIKENTKMTIGIEIILMTTLIFTFIMRCFK